MRSILAAAAIALLFAACDSPTAPRGFADGSVRFHDLNPQPLPPGLHLSTAGLNPQPLPPGRHLSTYACRVGAFEPPDPCNTGFTVATSDLNPQPLPPGRRSGSVTSVPGGSGVARTYACRVGRFEPPDPCSY